MSERFKQYRTYGITAVNAVRMVIADQGRAGYSPRAAWDAAILNATGSISVAQKVCPREAFLGLCSNGNVRGIPPGAYGNGVGNAGYATAAVEMLLTGQLGEELTTGKMWRVLLGAKFPGKTTKHNGQMNVVMGLWSAGLICGKAAY